MPVHLPTLFIVTVAFAMSVFAIWLSIQLLRLVNQLFMLLITAALSYALSLLRFNLKLSIAFDFSTVFT